MFRRRLLRLDIRRQPDRAGPTHRPAVPTFAGLAAALAVVVAACGSPAASSPPGYPTPEPDALRVVATTTVLADLVKNIGREKVVVTSIVPKGGEVHTYDPRPSDIARIADADLIVTNGLGLDEWLGRLARDAGADDVPVVELGEDLEGVRYLEGDEHGEEEAHEEEEDEHAEAVNPHLWLNVEYARKYVARIAETLAAADPANAATYEANAAEYDRELADLDTWIREQIETIPAENRKLVSFHEAFPYLAEAYGLEIVGVVVGAPGQDPSAGEVAALVNAIKAAGVKAVFSEAQFNDKLAQAIAEEAGATVESNLHNDSLGEVPADTYVGMMRYNIERIVAALR